MDSRGSETKVAERRREFNTESFSAEVNAAIDAVLPSEDPLDAPHFDAVAFINAKFPDEHSLEGVGSYAQEVEARIAGLDRDIYQAIRDQAVSGRQASQGIADCKVAIRELFNKITDIKGKAQDSEKMVDEICRDIRQLDAAKKNLETSITALKRLQMLVRAGGCLVRVAWCSVLPACSVRAIVHACTHTCIHACIHSSQPASQPASSLLGLYLYAWVDVLLLVLDHLHQSLERYGSGRSLRAGR